MSYPAYMRIHHESNAFCGPLTVCGEEDLWEIHEFGHAIHGNESESIWRATPWEIKHNPIWVVLETGAYLPALYSTNVDNHDCLDKVEIFWLNYSEKLDKTHFYFKHTIYPAKVINVQMIMPQVKDVKFQGLKHLVRIEFRYRWIEHLFFEGYYFTKAEWILFYTNESNKQIPEKYITGPSLSDEALAWEESLVQDESPEEPVQTKTWGICRALDNTPLALRKFTIRKDSKQVYSGTTDRDGFVKVPFDYSEEYMFCIEAK